MEFSLNYTFIFSHCKILYWCFCFYYLWFCYNWPMVTVKCLN